MDFSISFHIYRKWHYSQHVEEWAFHSCYEHILSKMSFSFNHFSSINSFIEFFNHFCTSCSISDFFDSWVWFWITISFSWIKEFGERGLNCLLDILKRYVIGFVHSSFLFSFCLYHLFLSFFLEVTVIWKRIDFHRAKQGGIRYPNPMYNPSAFALFKVSLKKLLVTRNVHFVEEDPQKPPDEGLLSFPRA